MKMYALFLLNIFIQNILNNCFGLIYMKTLYCIIVSIVIKSLYDTIIFGLCKVNKLSLILSYFEKKGYDFKDYYGLL